MQTFEVGDVRLQATYTPGHTDDHMAFIVTNNNADVAVDERLLVTGDLVLGRGTTIVYNLQQYMSSLDRVLGIRPTMLLPGHGPIISGSKDDTPNAVRVIEGYIAHRNMREQQIIAVLASSPPNAPPIPRNGGWRLEEVTSAVYTDITDPRIIIAAQNNTRLHLNKLLFEGRVNTDAQPVNSRVDGVSFTFYEPEEVRRMSVKQVVNPVLLDSLGNPTNGGLYDPAMGPFTRNHLCGTCSLSYFDCPGHFGHIELPAVVVNPMMFDTLYRFLQGCCPYCHHFTFKRVTAIRFVSKLRLLEYGFVQEANDLDNLLPRTGKSQDDDDDMEEDEDAPSNKKGGESADEYIDRIKQYVDDCLAKPTRATYKVTMVNQVRRQLIKDLIARSRNFTCQNCRGPVPRLRRDGYLKIFREPLTNKQRIAQQAKNFNYRD
ncbi:hypothetical protein GGF45_003531, partial [Coemansia sp. RSA 551]